MKQVPVAEKTEPLILLSGIEKLLLLVPMLAGLFLSEQLKSLFGLSVQDVFVYRQLGAATVGYGVMGIFQVYSHRWAELRLGSLMAAIFNMLAFFIGITALALGKPPLLPAVLVVAPLFLAAGNIAILVRKGK